MSRERDPFDGASVRGERIELATGERLTVLSEPEPIGDRPRGKEAFRALVRRGSTVQILELPPHVVLAWEMAGGRIGS